MKPASAKPQSKKQAPKPKAEKTPQSQKFIEAARELGCDEDESAFDEMVKKVAKGTPSRKESRSSLKGSKT
jgi:hypothetical protein